MNFALISSMKGNFFGSSSFLRSTTIQFLVALNSACGQLCLCLFLTLPLFSDPQPFNSWWLLIRVPVDSCVSVFTCHYKAKIIPYRDIIEVSQPVIQPPVSPFPSLVNYQPSSKVLTKYFSLAQKPSAANE